MPIAPRSAEAIATVNRVRYAVCAIGIAGEPLAEFHRPTNMQPKFEIIGTGFLASPHDTSTWRDFPVVTSHWIGSVE
jgi:hypothetical protein